MKKNYFLLMLMVFGVSGVWGQVGMTTTSSYTQNFNTLITTGTATWADNSTIANWYSQRTGTGTSYIADAGSGSAGSLYSYGTGTNTERALGTIGSGNAAAGSFAHGVLLRNTSGVTITGITVSYTLEQWRNGGNTTPNNLTFYYKTSSSTITSLTPGTNTTWTSVPGLTLSSPINTASGAALDGNNAANRVSASNVAIPSLSLANNDYIMLKWEDPDHSGTDHGLGIDDVTVSWTVPAGSNPTKLVVTSVSPSSPTRNSPFSITVQSQDNSNVAQNVASNVTVNLAKIVGTGTLSGTLTRTITSGTNNVTFTGLTYNVAENGVQVNAADQASALTTGSTTFNVLASASQLVFVGLPSSGGINTPLPSFTVEARRPDNSLDNTYTGNITISKASGPGTLSGTVAVAAVAGVATFSTLQFDLSGTYTLDANASGLASATSGNISITTASSSSDYFRSVVTLGNWNSLSSWQSSPDNTNWDPSTLIPDENANTITISSGDTITINTAVSADQVVIENTAVLLNSLGAFTIKDGTGDDIIIQNGGVFTVGSSSGPVFGTGTPTVNVNTGGTLRVARSGYTGNAAGVNLNNYVYQNASILDYTLATPFSASGVTFFPNATASAFPIFRVTGIIVGSMGGVNPTVFNGVFEPLTNVSLTAAGTKTFRYGISGAGNIDGTASGKFIIDGATASSLGGSGSLQVPTAAGLEISTTVNMASDKTITGNISLLANGYVQLGNNNITVAGNITGGSATSYIKTTGSGGLTLKNITTTTTFPVGNGTSYTPATLTNNGTADDFTVNVAAGTPCNADPFQSVNRVWTITEATPGGSVADITLQWNQADENLTFIRLLCAAVHCAGGIADIKGTKGSASGSDPYTQTITGISSFSPFGVTSDIVVLPIGVQYFNGYKQGNKHNLVWKINCNSAPGATMTIERSGNGRTFDPLYTVTADAVRCLDAFSYTDVNPLAGVNYYRLKSTDAGGRTIYSSIITLLNKEQGFEIVNITPNPAPNGQFRLNVTTTKQTAMDIIITDMAGRVVSKRTVSLISGFNAVDMNINNLASGTYQLYGNTADSKTKALSFVKQ